VDQDQHNTSGRRREYICHCPKFCPDGRSVSKSTFFRHAEHRQTGNHTDGPTNGTLIVDSTANTTSARQTPSSVAPITAPPEFTVPFAHSTPVIPPPPVPPPVENHHPIPPFPAHSPPSSSAGEPAPIPPELISRIIREATHEQLLASGNIAYISLFAKNQAYQECMDVFTRALGNVASSRNHSNGS